MKYSIIIAIYNRLNEAKELLTSLEEMKFDRGAFEVIFSDDGSTDGIKEYLEQYQSSSQLVVRYLFQQNKGPGAARNHGMEEAKGAYFIFVDSDCILPPHWLSAVDRAVVDENLDCFGGPDAAHDSFSSVQKAINYAMTSFLGTGGTRTGKGNVQKKYYPRSYNMGVSRQIYEDLGGMGGLRHGQDMEFSARIHRAGYKVGVIKEAYVFHKRRTSLRKFFKQVFNWGVTRNNLGKIDKGMLKPVHYFPSLVALGSVVAIVTPVIVPQFWWLWMVLLIGINFIALTAFFQSLFLYRSIWTAFLSVLTLFIQVFAYGLGFISGRWQMWRGKKEAKGFVKNYYK